MSTGAPNDTGQQPSAGGAAGLQDTPASPLFRPSPNFFSPSNEPFDWDELFAQSQARASKAQLESEVRQTPENLEAYGSDVPTYHTVRQTPTSVEKTSVHAEAGINTGANQSAKSTQELSRSPNSVEETPFPTEDGIKTGAAEGAKSTHKPTPNIAASENAKSNQQPAKQTSNKAAKRPKKPIAEICDICRTRHNPSRKCHPKCGQCFRHHVGVCLACPTCKYKHDGECRKRKAAVLAETPAPSPAPTTFSQVPPGRNTTDWGSRVFQHMLGNVENEAMLVNTSKLFHAIQIADVPQMWVLKHMIANVENEAMALNTANLFRVFQTEGVPQMRSSPMSSGESQQAVPLREGTQSSLAQSATNVARQPVLDETPSRPLKRRRISALEEPKQPRKSTAEERRDKRRDG